MRSGGEKNQFERFAKLLASVATLVTTGKRNLETVNDILHDVVFGKQRDLPAAKNWPEIVQLWGSRRRTDRNIALALAMLDMNLVSARDPRALALVQAYPECFGGSETRCAIPISLILTLAAQEGVAQGFQFQKDWAEKAKRAVEMCRSVGIDEYSDCDDRDGILGKLGIPYVTLRTRESNEWSPIPPAPDNWAQDLRTGEWYEYQGTSYIVLENDSRAHLLYIASRKDVDDEAPQMP